MFRDVGQESSFPEMSKYPFFKAGRDDLMVGGHHMLPAWKNFTPKCVLGLLHYKFSKQDFLKIQDALEQGQHWNGSFEYKCYAEWLRLYSDRSLLFPESREYTSPEELVRAGLINAIDWLGHGEASTRLRLSSISAWKDPQTRKSLIRMIRRRAAALFDNTDFMEMANAGRDNAGLFQEVSRQG